MEVQEINLYDLVKFYARNWGAVLTAIFVGAIVGLIYTFFIQTPLYKSDATALVVNGGTADTKLNNNYTELFRSRLVLDTVIDGHDYDGNYEKLLSRTTATNDKNTDILKVSIADPDPGKSRELLSTALESFKTEAGKLYGSENIKIVDSATLPTDPYNVKILQQVGLASAASFFLAVIVMFFVYDYRLSSGEATKVAPAAAVPAKKKPTTAKPTPKKSTKSKKTTK